MGTLPQAELDAWLRNGGTVVTASDRAARALTAAFNRARRAEGFTAWPAPNILDWTRFARNAWAERSLDDRLLLNSRQELDVWEQIASRRRHPATSCSKPRAAASPRWPWKRMSCSANRLLAI